MKAILFARQLLLATLLTGISAAQALDINTASAAELTQLKGIGPKRAEAIVHHRETNGPFTSPEALLEVPGIGAKVLTDNAKDIELAPRPSASAQ